MTDKTFRDYYRGLKREGEFDFGDDAQEMTKAQAAADARIPTKKGGSLSEMVKWKEARGFIKPDGKMERLDSMPHFTFASRLGYPIIKADGTKEVRKYPDGEKGLCMDTGLIRWSPETKAITLYREPTVPQIRTIRAIVKASGYQDLSIEFMKADGEKVVMPIESGETRDFDVAIAKINAHVNRSPYSKDLKE